MRHSRGWKWGILAALLTSHTFFLMHAALRNSACFDEGAHLAAGCAYLKWHEFSIYDLSPPLLRAWAALPAWLDGAQIPPAKLMRNDPPTSRHWLYFQSFESQNLPHLARYILWGRLMLMPFSLAVALVIFHIARSIYSDAAGLIACAFWCLSPTVIADASTIGTDIAFLLGALIAIFWWWKFLQSTSKKDLLICAAGMALACCSKFTAVALAPMLVALAIIAIAMRKSSIKIALQGICIVALLSYVTLNLTYEYRLLGDRLDDFNFQSQTMQTITRYLPAGFRVPFPHDLVEGIDAQKWEIEGKYAQTLFGQTYFGSDWRYYPVLLATKLTLAELALILLLAASLFFIRPSAAEIPLAMLAFGYLAYVICGVSFNNGLRYILPAMTAIAVLAGRLLQRPSFRAASIVAVLVAVLECSLATPHFHSYCNPFTNHSGFSVPDRDWGQSLIDLKNWMNRNHQARITVVNFSSISPKAYGIDDADLFAPLSTQYVAISRRFMNGMAYKTESDFVFVRPWKRLQQTTPVADLGGLLIYRAADVQRPGEPPWIVRINSLSDLLNEPARAPIRNLTDRLQSQ